jgi:hypothetical protein
VWVIVIAGCWVSKLIPMWFKARQPDETTSTWRLAEALFFLCVCVTVHCSVLCSYPFLVKIKPV